MVSVVFIKRGITEIGLLYILYAHVSDITNQSLYLFLRTVQNRTSATMADRSELACDHWLDKELAWGMGMILSRKPSQGMMDRVHWWNEHARAVWAEH